MSVQRMTAAGIPRLETAAQRKRAWLAGWLSWACNEHENPYPDGSQQAAEWAEARLLHTPALGTVLPCRLHGLEHRP